MNTHTCFYATPACVSLAALAVACAAVPLAVDTTGQEG